MSDRSSIEWTDASWNPIRGTNGRHHCVRISEGCKHCYAATMNHRFKGPDYVKGADTPRLDEEALLQPLKWKAPRRIFVCSMTDLFMDEHSDEMIAHVFAIMGMTTRHTFQVLTKRSKRMREFCSKLGRHHEIDIVSIAAKRIRPDGPAFFWKLGPNGWSLPNVWLGVSAENQERADERIPDLLATPAAVRFVSAEPLLSGINFGRWFGGANEANRGSHIPDGPERTVRDRRAGTGVEERISSGKPDVARIPSGADHVRRETSPRAGSSPGLSALQRTDTGRNDDQSQERNEGRQQAGQPRTGDVVGAGPSRAPHPEAGTAGSGRGEERDGETHAGTGRGHSDAALNRGELANPVRKVRGSSADNLSDSPGPTLDLVIVGGESGHQARPCDVSWIRSIKDQCAAAGVACFVKQLGARPSDTTTPIGRDSFDFWKVKDPKGGDMAEWPDDLRVREFPR